MNYSINSFKDRIDILGSDTLYKSRSIINAQMKYSYDFLEPVESIVFKKIYDNRSSEDQDNYWLDIQHINEINSVSGIYERLYVTTENIRGGQLYIYGSSSADSDLPLICSSGKDGIYYGSVELASDMGEVVDGSLLVTFNNDLLKKPNFHKSGLYIADRENTIIDLVLDNDNSLIQHNEVVTFAISDNVPSATIKLKLTCSSYSEDNPNDTIKLTDLRQSVTLYRTGTDRYTVLTPYSEGAGGGGEIEPILNNYVTKYTFNTAVTEITEEIEKLKDQPSVFVSNSIEGNPGQIKQYDDGEIVHNQVVITPECKNAAIVLKDNVDYVDNDNIYYLYFDKTQFEANSRLLITNLTDKGFYTLDNALYIPPSTTTELFYCEDTLTPICSDYIEGRPNTDPKYVSTIITYSDDTGYAGRLKALEDEIDDIYEQIDSVITDSDIDSIVNG